MNDVYRSVWKPLTGLSEVKARTRRMLERTYVEQLNAILNPVKTEKAGAADRIQSSDVLLYAEQQLDTIEKFCKTQAAHSTGINLMHYNDLLRQLKLIRERRVTVK